VAGPECQWKLIDGKMKGLFKIVCGVADGCQTLAGTRDGRVVLAGTNSDWKLLKAAGGYYHLFCFELSTHLQVSQNVASMVSNKTDNTCFHMVDMDPQRSGVASIQSAANHCMELSNQRKDQIQINQQRAKELEDAAEGVGKTSKAVQQKYAQAAEGPCSIC